MLLLLLLCLGNSQPITRLCWEGTFPKSVWRPAKRKAFACEWFRVTRRCSEVQFAHTDTVHFAFAHSRKQNCIEGVCASSDCQEIEWGLFGSNEKF